jgi:hypothetical protein
MHWAHILPIRFRSKTRIAGIIFPSFGELVPVESSGVTVRLVGSNPVAPANFLLEQFCERTSTLANFHGKLAVETDAIRFGYSTSCRFKAIRTPFTSTCPLSKSS